MNTVKITVIKKSHYEDLIEEYENPISHACDINLGDVFFATSLDCPLGLCPEAWKSMLPFVESLLKGVGNFYDGWMKNPMSAMISCNDGFRPVSFLIELV